MGGFDLHAPRSKDAGIPEAAVMDLVSHDSKQMSAHHT
jgi:hypothetical protein